MNIFFIFTPTLFTPTLFTKNRSHIKPEEFPYFWWNRHDRFSGPPQQGSLQRQLVSAALFGAKLGLSWDENHQQKKGKTGGDMGQLCTCYGKIVVILWDLVDFYMSFRESYWRFEILETLWELFHVLLWLLFQLPAARMRFYGIYSG